MKPLGPWRAGDNNPCSVAEVVSSIANKVVSGGKQSRLDRLVKLGHPALGKVVDDGLGGLDDCVDKLAIEALASVEPVNDVRNGAGMSKLDSSGWRLPVVKDDEVASDVPRHADDARERAVGEVSYLPNTAQCSKEIE